MLTTDANAGKVALVTGGGTGIGAATALELARTGASVVICGRARGAARRRADARSKPRGGACLAVPTDVRELDQVEALVDAALERFGAIDLLVNNAGGQFTAPAEADLAERLAGRASARGRRRRGRSRDSSPSGR